MIHSFDNKISSGNMNNVYTAENLGFVITCTRNSEGKIDILTVYSFEEFSKNISNGTVITVYKTIIEYKPNPNKGNETMWWSDKSTIGYVIASKDSIGVHNKGNYILPTYWVYGIPPVVA